MSNQLSIISNNQYVCHAASISTVKDTKAFTLKKLRKLRLKGFA